MPLKLHSWVRPFFPPVSVLKIFERTEPFYLNDYSAYYIFNKILGPELFKSSLGNQSVKDAFGNTVKYSTAYLSGNFR